MKEFSRSIQSLLFFSLIIALLVFVATKYILPEHTGLYTWASLIYFVLFTGGFHYGLLKSTEGKPQQFVRYFMSATTLKLLVHIVVIIAYSLTHRGNAMNFILGFFVFYMLFMVFEIRQAMLINKKLSNIKLAN